MAFVPFDLKSVIPGSFLGTYPGWFVPGHTYVGPHIPSLESSFDCGLSMPACLWRRLCALKQAFLSGCPDGMQRPFSISPACRREDKLQKRLASSALTFTHLMLHSSTTQSSKQSCMARARTHDTKPVVFAGRAAKNDNEITSPWPLMAGGSCHAAGPRLLGRVRLVVCGPYLGLALRLTLV